VRDDRRASVRSISASHPFDPTAPAISRDKPLIVGYNRDEMNFFFAQNRDTDVYALTDATLKARLVRDLGSNAAAVLAAYQKSRPEASPADLYVAIASARFAGSGSIVIGERKYAQHGAPVYMYVFAHESDRVIPGTSHTFGPRTRGRLSTSSTTSSLPAAANRDSRRTSEARLPTRGRRACRPLAT